MSKASEAVKARLDHYLDVMESASKRPSALYVTKQQKEILDKAARSKAAKDPEATKDQIAAATYSMHRGYRIIVAEQ